MPNSINSKSDHGLEGRRQKVAAAAISIFIQKGIENTSVNDITELAKISERTFFRYFDSMESVLFVNHPRHLKMFEDALRKATPSDQPEKSIANIFETIMNRFAGMDEEYRRSLRNRYKLIHSNKRLFELSILSDRDYEEMIAAYIVGQSRGLISDQIRAAVFSSSLMSMAREISFLYAAEKDDENLLSAFQDGLKYIMSVHENVDHDTKHGDIVIFVPGSDDSRRDFLDLIGSKMKNTRKIDYTSEL